MPAGERKADLFGDVVALLRDDNITVKGMTEVQLRHIINMRVGLYETEIRMYQETLSEIRNKLAEAERRGP